MAKRAKRTESAPSRLRELLARAVRQARQDAGTASDPKIQMLYETTAEVLDGLIRACDRVEQKSEPAWT